MRIEIITQCEICEGEFLNRRQLPIIVKEMECPECEQKGTLKVIEIKELKSKDQDEIVKSAIEYTVKKNGEALKKLADSQYMLKEDCKKVKYNDYLELKKMVQNDETTTNYVMEFLKIPRIVARCLVKDWKEQQEEIDETSTIENVWFEVFIEGKQTFFPTKKEVVNKVKADVHFEVDGNKLWKDLRHLNEGDTLELREDVYVKRLENSQIEK